MSKDEHNLGAEARSAIGRLADLFGLPVLQPGWVWLAGSGPGDVSMTSLLTLSGLAQADVIFCDALVNDELLKLCRPDAEIVDAGKRGGKKSPKQDSISRQLTVAARSGARVLRLKGGDPFVFGRGGEEALALVREKIPFRIIPGVTAGIGGLAYAGIPVTHRDTNQSVTFITGHGADGGVPDLDWEALARGAPTLVLYMARKHAGEIARLLIANGRFALEPVAIVSNASLEDQQTRITTLDQLHVLAGQANTPAIIVIGENVRLAEGLDWLGALKDGRILDPDPLKRDALEDVS